MKRLSTSELKLSAMRALLGNLSENVAAAAVALEQQRIELSFYFFREPDENDIERMEESAGLMIADFSYPFIIKTRSRLASSLTVEDLDKCFLLRCEVTNNAFTE